MLISALGAAGTYSHAAPPLGSQCFHREPANPLNVPYRRRTEHSRILAAELRDALVANAIRSAGRIGVLGKQNMPRFREPQTLLVLQRAHGGDRFEMLV